MERMHELLGPPRGGSDVSGFGDITLTYMTSEGSSLFVFIDLGEDTFENFWDCEIIGIQSISGEARETVWHRDPESDEVVE